MEVGRQTSEALDKLTKLQPAILHSLFVRSVQAEAEEKKTP